MFHIISNQNKIILAENTNAANECWQDILWQFFFQHFWKEESVSHFFMPQALNALKLF